MDTEAKVKLRGATLREVVRSKYAEGKTGILIAQELGVSPATVQQHKRALGLVKEGSELDKWVNAHPEIRRAFATIKASAQRNYVSYFRQFAKWCNKLDNPEELWSEPWDQIRDRIIDYRLYLEEQGMAATTIVLRLSVIRRFFEYKNIVFKGKFITSGNAAVPRDENEKEEISPEQLRELIEIGDPLEKAMYICQYQSGLGASELCNLKLKHVGTVEKGEVKLNVENGVITLNLRREKTNVKFTTFIGHDSIVYLQKWIDLRQSGKLFLDREIGKKAIIRSSNDPLFVTYSRRYKKWGVITPINYARMLRNRIKQLGWITDDTLRDKGLLSTYRPHALRMSFSNRLKHKAKLGWDYVEVFLGHKFSGTDSAYVKYTEQELLQAYKQGEPFISLTLLQPFATDDQYIELKRENELLKQRMEEQSQRLQKLEKFANMTFEEYLIMFSAYNYAKKGYNPNEITEKLGANFDLEKILETMKRLKDVR